MSNRYRKPAIYTIDQNILEDFNKISKNNAINKSRLVEKLIKEWIDQQSIKISKRISSDDNKLLVKRN